MAKDFAKNSKNRNSASRFKTNKSKPSISGWTWLVVGLIFGIVISFVINLQQLSPDIKTILNEPKKQPSAKSRYQAVPAEASSESDFSYHNLLQKKIVKATTEETVPSSASLIEKRYIMQCGSFRHENAAESLRAQIALNGFEASINPTVEKNSKRWYRVVLGPYTSKRRAESEKHQLERNNINNCKIW